MASPEELYQEIILHHNRQPRNYGILEDASHVARGNNPVCGDETTVQLRVVGDCIESAGYAGQGCAISRASASIMTEAIAGLGLEQARSVASRVLTALCDPKIELDLQKHGDVAALMGVRNFPARIKCATLPWQALVAAIDGEATVSSEEIDR